jgi:type II secretory pathway pseudopilin PulG
MAGFTMVEIAISLAIIGIALVSIIGVLPIGMNTQKDNREETMINQDATILMEAIRGGARGLDDLTNYVFAITNYWIRYNANGSINNSNVNGYTYTNYSIGSGYYCGGTGISNGMNIIGLLSTPLYADANGRLIPNLFNGGYSNRVVAYVRSLSGPAVEKPPQDNEILRADSFGYRVICVNAPVTKQLPPLWQDSQAYEAGDTVTVIPVNGPITCWRAKVAVAANSASMGFGAPGTNSILWQWASYSQQLDANLRELRLTFFWPLLPNNQVGPGRQTFRTLIAGQIIVTNLAVGPTLYFYQPQSFGNVTLAP